MVIYETINKVNGKRYIGKDKNNDPNYYGSGKLLHKAIKKYGKDNFVKTILEECTDEEQMSNRERHWINITNAQQSRQYYNIGAGGDGGDNHTHRPKEEYDEFINRMKEVTSGTNNSMYGRKHTKKAIQLQKVKAKGRYTSEWFIERYGKTKGLIKYQERCDMLSNRDMKGKNNPAYVHIDKDELVNTITTTDLGFNALCEHFKCGNTAMYNKLQMYFGIKKLKKIREQLKQTKGH